MLVLSRTVMLSPSVTLTNLPVKVSAAAAMDRRKAKQRPITEVGQYIPLSHDRHNDKHNRNQQHGNEAQGTKGLLINVQYFSEPADPYAEIVQ